MNKLKIIIAFCILALCCHISAGARVQDFVPQDSWTYRAYDRLVELKYFRWPFPHREHLYEGHHQFGRYEFAVMVDRMNKLALKGKEHDKNYKEAKRLIKQLSKEFASEIQEINPPKPPKPKK